MDDGEIAHDADLHVMRLQVLDRYRHRGLFEESSTVDQRLVGIGAVEFRRQYFIEPFDVGILQILLQKSVETCREA